MSRNLGRTDCRFCGADVVLVEKPRVLTKEDTGAYFEEFRGMVVANAECRACLALYLAWIELPLLGIKKDPEIEFSDLSFRHSFNDEPDERDLPRYQVEKQWVRTGLWTGSAYARLGPVK